MVSYRFCRTDDIPLLVEAYNRCWRASHPDDPELDEHGFKVWVRQVQLWASSCMVAMANQTIAGVLLGAKRDAATRIFRIAIHPDHQGQEHGRHLLTSLSSKLAILGPPTLTAEVPDDWPGTLAFFAANDYEVAGRAGDWRHTGAVHQAGPAMVIPFDVDDLEANDAFDASRRRSWERELATLKARREQIEGLAVATFDGIGAYLLCRTAGPTAELVSFGSAQPEERARHLGTLVTAWREAHGEELVVPRATADELAPEELEACGFELTRSWSILEATARPA